MHLSNIPALLASQASVANAAGATKTGSSVDLTDYHGAVALITVTNGATGPTIAATGTVQVSVDGTNWITVETVLTNTGNDVVTVKKVELPPCQKARINFAGNTAQSVTVKGDILAYQR